MAVESGTCSRASVPARRSSRAATVPWPVASGDLRAAPPAVRRVVRPAEPIPVAGGRGPQLQRGPARPGGPSRRPRPPRAPAGRGSSPRGRTGRPVPVRAAAAAEPSSSRRVASVAPEASATSAAARAASARSAPSLRRGGGRHRSPGAPPPGGRGRWRGRPHQRSALATCSAASIRFESTASASRPALSNRASASAQRPRSMSMLARSWWIGMSSWVGSACEITGSMSSAARPTWPARRSAARHVPAEHEGADGLETPRRGGLEPRAAGVDDLVADPAGLPEDLGARDRQADVALGIGTAQLAWLAASSRRASARSRSPVTRSSWNACWTSRLRCSAGTSRPAQISRARAVDARVPRRTVRARRAACRARAGRGRTRREGAAERWRAERALHQLQAALRVIEPAPDAARPPVGGGGIDVRGGRHRRPVPAEPPPRRPRRSVNRRASIAARQASCLRTAGVPSDATSSGHRTRARRHCCGGLGERRTALRPPARRGPATRPPRQGPRRAASARRPRRATGRPSRARAQRDPAVLVGDLERDQPPSDGLGQQWVPELDVVPGRRDAAAGGPPARAARPPLGGAEPGRPRRSRASGRDRSATPSARAIAHAGPPSPESRRSSRSPRSRGQFLGRRRARPAAR